MKLISESIEEVEYLFEDDEATGKKNYKIRGPFLQAEVKNRNGRIYPLPILEKEPWTKEVLIGWSTDGQTPKTTIAAIKSKIKEA